MFFNGHGRSDGLSTIGENERKKLALRKTELIKGHLRGVQISRSQSNPVPFHFQFNAITQLTGKNQSL